MKGLVVGPCVNWRRRLSRHLGFAEAGPDWNKPAQRLTVDPSNASDIYPGVLRHTDSTEDLLFGLPGIDQTFYLLFVDTESLQEHRGY